LKDGLLAKQVTFRTEAEAAEFAQLLHQLGEELRPEGVIERMLAQEIAICWWDILIAHGELNSARNRRIASQELLTQIISKSDNQRVSVLPEKPKDEKDSSGEEGFGWDCREVVLRAGTTNSVGFGGAMGKTGRSSVLELRLGWVCFAQSLVLLAPNVSSVARIAAFAYAYPSPQAPIEVQREWTGANPSSARVSCA
jgi:hypothetical protein